LIYSILGKSSRFGQDWIKEASASLSGHSFFFEIGEILPHLFPSKVNLHFQAGGLVIAVKPKLDFTNQLVFDK
jgi:hypothetical protein